MNKKVILIITDGWGVGENNTTNPITKSNLPTFEILRKNYPYCTLQASGIAVGLPWGEEGNSEVGHLTIGAGKVLYQHYPRITMSIHSLDFFKNEKLKKAILMAKNKIIHLAGLFGEKNVHSSFSHLEALIKKCEESENIETTYLHLFTDGKDGDLKACLPLLHKIKNNNYKKVKIASLGGRFFALDRDGNYERTYEMYRAMKGEIGRVFENEEEYLRECYKNDLNDQIIPPAREVTFSGIKDGDSLIFFDFREDSIRQICSFFVAPFKVDTKTEYKIDQTFDLFVSSMTEYSEKIKTNILFEREETKTCLSKEISDNNLNQLKIAETEKYAHVTYFFNGLNEKPFTNEIRILVPSKNSKNHAEHPEMQAEEITNRLIQSIDDNGMDFILVNFANADMIAHTGNFEASIKALEFLDGCIKKILSKALEKKYEVIITSDHGNIERMINPLNGNVETKHDTSPVHFFLINNNNYRSDGYEYNGQTLGMLSDVAPTILEIMNLEKPESMTGVSLLKYFR